MDRLGQCFRWNGVLSLCASKKSFFKSSLIANMFTARDCTYFYLYWSSIIIAMYNWVLFLMCYKWCEFQQCNRTHEEILEIYATVLDAFQRARVEWMMIPLASTVAYFERHASCPRRVRVVSASCPRRVRVASASRPRRVRVVFASCSRSVRVVSASPTRRSTIKKYHWQLFLSFGINVQVYKCLDDKKNVLPTNSPTGSTVETSVARLRRVGETSDVRRTDEEFSDDHHVRGTPGLKESYGR